MDRLNMKKCVLSSSKTPGGYVKSIRKPQYISTILKMNELAVDVFGIKTLEYDDLKNLTLNELKNIETELRIQLGFKRRYNFK